MKRRRTSGSNSAPAKPAAPAKPVRPYLLPSPNAATNLLIVDIIMRGASSLMRTGVEQRIARASRQSDNEAQAKLPGKTMVKTLALYGASKLATRSPLGLGVVVGALAVKTLYDIGKAREARGGKAREARGGKAREARGGNARGAAPSNEGKGAPDAVPEANTNK